MRITKSGFVMAISALAIEQASAGELHALASMRAEGAVSVATPSGRTSFPAREVVLQGRNSDGRPAEANLFVVFDPGTGLFRWSCSLSSPSGTPRLFILEGAKRDGGTYDFAEKDRIVGFGVGPAPPEIHIREFTVRATSLDDAENKSVQELVSQMDAMLTIRAYGWRIVPLLKALGGPVAAHDFLAPTYSAQIGHIKIVDISRNVGKWEIVLEGQWKANLILNDRYEIVKLERAQ